MLHTFERDDGPRADLARPFRQMPRPRPHPLLGNFPEWLGMTQGRMVLQRLQRYAEECGPLARVPLGPTSIVAVSDVDVVDELLASDDANYKGWTYILTRTVLDNVLLLNGEAWAHGRRTYRNALREVEVLPSADRCAHALVQRLGRGSPRELDLAVLTRELVADTVGHFVARAQVGEALEPDRARIQHELAAVGMDLQCQPWAYFDPRRWTALRGSVRRFQAYFRGLVAARRREPGARVGDVLDGVLGLAARGEHDDDDASIADTLINIFFTAHDVLASSTGWCLWLLASHPQVQSRLRGELHALGSGPRGIEAITSAPYLDWVIKEALRLYPGYSLFGRNPQRPTRLAGYRVPRSALIIVSPYVIHRMPRYWAQPELFDPDRWRDSPPGLARGSGAYLPFGVGHRRCLASHLAYPIMKLLVARVIEHLELHARPGHVPRLRYCGTGYAENGLWATLRAREGR